MMKTQELLNLKKLLDEDVITKEEFEKQKKDILKREKQEKNKKVVGAVCAALAVIFFFSVIAVLLTPQEEGVSNNVNTETVKTEEIKIPNQFDQDFPISVSGGMEDDILGFPQLLLNITNDTEKNILAIQVYFKPVDVYGAEVKSFLASNKLESDSVIMSNASTTLYWQMLDTDIRGGDVWIYSVYFEDGTEWGNRNAPVSDITKYGYKMSVKY